MAEKIRICERAGVNPKWTKYKTVIGYIKALEAGWAGSDVTLVEMELNRIREYNTREDSSSDKKIPNKRNATHSWSEELGRIKVHEVLATAPDNPLWLGKLVHWMRYYEVGIKQAYFWHQQFDVLFPDSQNGGLRMFSTQTAAQMMATMAILGWKDAVIFHGYLIHSALNRSYQLELQYTEEHRRAQAFMLRLFADWVGDLSHQWPGYAYDEPIYEMLLQLWRTPDPEALIPCLLAACDRHTHQAGKDTLKKFYDFNSDWHLERVPIEILFIFRLREWEGFANPVLDHPLMVAPFDSLPPEQPVPELDELMQGVLKRAREDWPQYDEVLSLAALKQG
ncbi:hypothetical protein [Iodobacter sp.]|uniref:hypothetical protein n=1 Tax=Iodobacter sp. TaxID=1915058 RepID=UPI0025E025CE|nr:hypothetical protein [Iodobacter sp.]